MGAAKAEAYKLGVESLGGSAYTAMQLAASLGENKVKLVPEIAVSGNGGAAGLAEALIARMLQAPRRSAAGRARGSRNLTAR